MGLVDFQSEFRKYVKEWIAKNMSECDSVDEIENLLPELYMKWIDTPLKILDDQSPEFYFQQFKDAESLIDFMLVYIKVGIKIPDLLFDHITSLGKKSEKKLVCALSLNDLEEISNGKGKQNAKVIIIQLLNEMQAQTPMNDYIEIIAARKDVDEIADAAEQALENLGDKIVEPILKALNKSENISAMESFLDIIINHSDDDRIFDFLVSMLVRTQDRKSLYANYLGKYGDERAIPMLQKLLSDADTDYLDYIQIRNAIEELGENVDIVRDFKDDPSYAKLQKNK